MNIWTAACNGNIKFIDEYFHNGGEVNKRVNLFNVNHSLIMGALRNKDYETAALLYDYGERVTKEEEKEVQEKYSDFITYL